MTAAFRPYEGSAFNPGWTWAFKGVCSFTGRSHREEEPARWMRGGKAYCDGCKERAEKAQEARKKEKPA